MQDQSEDWAVLREQADVLMQQTSRIQAKLQPVQAADASGQVLVHVDAHGSVSSVNVGFAWEQNLSKTDLAPAVMEAISAATALRLEQFGNAAAEVEDEPAPRARPAATPSTVSELRDRFAEAPDEAAAAEQFLADILAQAIEGLDEANQLLSEHSTRVHTARSGPGHVTASVNGSGSLQSLDIDDSWLRAAHPANLGREITDAITKAADRARREGLTAALHASKLAHVVAQTTGVDYQRTPRED